MFFYFFLFFLNFLQKFNFYSTSPPSGNQVDGLPLDLHTRAVVGGVGGTPALICEKAEKML